MTEVVANAAQALKRVGSIVRRIIGVPDYDTYVVHMEKTHPGCSVLSKSEFERQRMADRYSKPGNRCC